MSTLLDAGRALLRRIFPSDAPKLPPQAEPWARTPGDRRPRTTREDDKRKAKRKSARAARKRNRR